MRIGERYQRINYFDEGKDFYFIVEINKILSETILDGECKCLVLLSIPNKEQIGTIKYCNSFKNKKYWKLLSNQDKICE